MLADVVVSTTGAGTFLPQQVGLHRVENVIARAADTVSTDVRVNIQTTTAGATHTMVVRTEGTDTYDVATSGEYRIEFIGW
jgi:hypothetical protein